MSDREAEQTGNASYILAKKEIRLLFKSKRRIFLLSITPIMILLIGVGAIFGANSAQNATEDPVKVWVINESPSNYTTDLLNYYSTINNTEFIEPTGTYDELKDSQNMHILIHFPTNFTEQMNAKDVAAVNIIYNDNSSRYHNIAIQFGQFTALYEQQLIRQENPDIAFERLDPQVSQVETEDKPGLSTELANSLFIIPVYIIFFVVIPPISLIMISVTIEREENTLETLFLQPVSRKSIIMGKIMYGIGIVLGVLILDIIAGLIDVLLINIFITEDAGGLVNELLTQVVDLLGADIILYFILTVALISVLVVGIAVLLSLVAKDEREANLISGILPMILFSIIVVVQVVQIDQLSFASQTVLSFIPMIGILVAFYISLVSGQIGLIGILSAVGQVVWIYLIISFAARLSESESILELTMGKVFEEMRKMIFRR